MILFRGDDYTFDDCNDNYSLMMFRGDDFVEQKKSKPLDIKKLTRLERKLLDLLKKDGMILK